MSESHKKPRRFAVVLVFRTQKLTASGLFTFYKFICDFHIAIFYFEFFKRSCVLNYYYITDFTVHGDFVLGLVIARIVLFHFRNSIRSGA